jgi:peptidoglycan LD-endopeptidase LytH
LSAIQETKPTSPARRGRRRTAKRLLTGFCALLLIGFLLPEQARIPVQNASSKDWNPKSFWYFPWGRSGVHKGIDIFAKHGTPVLSATPGIVLMHGELERGGNVVLVLGPKWRLHYYAHLASIDVPRARLVWSGQPIGSVGDTGNARGKPAHLHYSILRLWPALWRMDRSPQGYMKAFFLDPNELI